MSNKEDKARIKLLERALFDVLDGNGSIHDIQANTGLPIERCGEINCLLIYLIMKLDKDPTAF